MKRADIVQRIITPSLPTREKGLAFAPTNIALCKYWGKRNAELNLPETASLSISLPDKGALTTIKPIDQQEDVVILNKKEMAPDSLFVKRIVEFLNLFRGNLSWRLAIDIQMNLPVAAGLASSACGFASLVCALNDLFEWKLSHQQLSILARLGSGSAARSLWEGFVEWQVGTQLDGMDSYANPLPMQWQELRVGILSISDQEKYISSRDAMRRTVDTSPLYAQWPSKVAHDLAIIKQAILEKNFPLLGATAESNAMNMHATMLGSWPPVCYFLPETIMAMHKVWEMRHYGLEVYFTQDAGPNLKLLFLENEAYKVQAAFPEVEIIKVFDV